MRYLSMLFVFALFLLALGFAIKNSEVVTLHNYLGYQWQAPLVVILLTVLSVGVGAGIIASLGFIFKQRSEISRLKKELSSRPLLPAVNQTSTPATDNKTSDTNDGI